MSIENLSQEPYVSILCYPRPNSEEAAARIDEMKNLGVTGIIFEGRTQIGRLGILGKGCVSIVVKAKVSEGEYALKIRRIDANRASMERESALHLWANSVGVGPKLYAWSKNFLLMELVRGEGVVEWLKSLKGSGSVQHFRNIASMLLDQCYRLDQAGLDHGQLSNLRDHVYVDEKVVIIDFETASSHRRVKNLTSAVQYLFIGGPISNRNRRLLSLRDTSAVIDTLREYKKLGNLSSYQNLLGNLKLSKAKKTA